MIFSKTLSLSIRTQIGRLRRGVEYFVSPRMDRNAEATAVPVFDFSGTICSNLEKMSITVNRYF